MGTILPWTPRPQVHWIGKQSSWKLETPTFSPEIQCLEHRLCHRVPGLIVFDMPVIGVMRPMADAPPMIRHKNERVHDVAN